MDEILQALPVPAAMAVTAAIALWRQLLLERKESAAAIAAKDAEIKALTKDLVSTARGLDVLREKHERALARSSNPPQSS